MAKSSRPGDKPDPTGSALPRSGRVDPDRLDVAKKPKRKRKARNRPEPSEELRQAEAAMEKRLLARPVPPGIMLEPAGYDEEHWTAPHSDRELWTLQLAEAFGTRSRSVISAFVGQLESLCDDRKQWDEDAQQWRIDEDVFSTALAMVNAMKPRNEIEAAGVLQMVSVHLMHVNLAERAIRHGDARTAAIAGKLARTFNDQVRLQRELKGKGRSTRQSIKVTKETRQYVQYNDNRGGCQNCAQPQATDEGDEIKRARIPEQRAALPSPNEGNGGVVPFTGGSRSPGLPDARREKPRCAEG